MDKVNDSVLMRLDRRGIGDTEVGWEEAEHAEDEVYIHVPSVSEWW